MPTLARPDVDRLEGLTTAIIVDQERMGANPRSTVGTATDANTLLRILFSRLGEPHVGPPTAYSFNVPTRRPAGVEHREGRAGRRRSVVKDAVYLGGMCPRCEGMGQVSDIDRTALYDDTKSLREGALTVPGYSMDGWYGRLFEGVGPADGQAHRVVHREAARHDALRAPDQDQGRGRQPHLRGHHPQDPEVDALQGPRGDAAARARASSSGRSPSRPAPSATAPGSPPRCWRPRSTARTSPSCARCRSATWPAWVRELDEPSVAPLLSGAAAPARLVRRDRARLPLARPAGRHALRRRGAAHQDDPAPRLLPHRRHLRLRRADDRAAPARHRPDEPAAPPAARQGQHRARRRAQAGDDRHRRPRRRPRAGRRRGGRRRSASRAASRGCARATPSPVTTSTTGRGSRSAVRSASGVLEVRKRVARTT